MPTPATLTDPAVTGEAATAPDASDQPTTAPEAAAPEAGSQTPSSEPAQPTEEPVDLVDPSEGYIPPQVSGTDEDLLTGPGGPPRGYSLAPDVPAGAQHWLPALQTAASAPGAPPEFVNLMKLITSQLGSTQEG